MLEQIADYKDSLQKAAQFREKAHELELDEKFKAAMNHSHLISIDSQKQAIAIFETIIDFRDSKERIENCRRKIEDLQKSAQLQTQLAYQSYGLCQHCGGHFTGLFSKKCSVCGKPKDY